MIAAQLGRTEIALSLITAGASVDLQDRLLQTALMHATYRTNTEIAQLLLKAGAKDKSDLNK